MELSTFGTLLAFAIELEEGAARFYLDAAENVGHAGAREAFLAFARQNTNRKALLVATRQEHVTEMVLEPINDLRRHDYEVRVGLTRGMNGAQLLKLAMAVEEKAQRFYADAATKARHLLAGVARRFARLAREKEERLHELQALFSETVRRKGRGNEDSSIHRSLC